MAYSPTVKIKNTAGVLIDPALDSTAATAATNAVAAANNAVIAANNAAAAAVSAATAATAALSATNILLKPTDTLAKVTRIDTITNPVAITGSITASNPNLDVPLSTRLKPADTLAKVSVVDTITNPVVVISQIDTGNNFSASIAVTAATTRTHAMSIRPRLLFNSVVNRGKFNLVNIEILGGLNQVQWELVVGAAFSPVPTWTPDNATFSFMEIATNGTFANLTTGIVSVSGFIPAGTAAHTSISRDVNIGYPIALNVGGAQTAIGTLTLLLTAFTGTSACMVIMNWREVA
jgi:hypothetical protein